MLKNFNRLWVFGDSFSTPNYCVEPKESFWGLTADYIGAKTILNYSWPGNSFNSVTHMLVSMQEQYNFDTDFFIVGVPPLERLTVFDNYKDTSYNSTQIDTLTWQENKMKIECHHGLEVIQGDQAGKMMIYNDRSWTETKVLTDIFFITTWLESVGAKYLIVNLSKPLDKENVWGPSKFVLPYGKAHNRCILFNGTYYDVNLDKHKPADFEQYGWMGHHGPAGNKHFFEASIKDKLC